MEENKKIYKMLLHERIEFGEGLMVMRVAGGWIYSMNLLTDTGNYATSVFVPNNGEFNQ